MSEVAVPSDSYLTSFAAVSSDDGVEVLLAVKTVLHPEHGESPAECFKRMKKYGDLKIGDIEVVEELEVGNGWPHCRGV